MTYDFNMILFDLYVALHDLQMILYGLCMILYDVNFSLYDLCMLKKAMKKSKFRDFQF